MSRVSYQAALSFFKACMTPKPMPGARLTKGGILHPKSRFHKYV